MKEISRTKFEASTGKVNCFGKIPGHLVTKTLTNDKYDRWVNNTIAYQFEVNVKDIQEQENLIKESRGFFWDKIVRRIFGYKFDILRMRNNAKGKKKEAFKAAVAKIGYETNLEIETLLKISKKRSEDQIEQIESIKGELKKEISVEDEIFDKAFEDFLRVSNWGENSLEAFQGLLKTDKVQFKKEFKDFFHERKVSLDEKTLKGLEGFVKKDMADNDLNDMLWLEAERTGLNDKYGVIAGRGDNKIEYTLIELKGDPAEIKAKWDERIKQWKDSFNDFSKNNDIEKKNVELFQNLIIYLFSQSADHNFFADRLGLCLCSKDYGFFGFDGLGRSQSNLTIEILDKKTIKMNIEAKDHDKLFKWKKGMNSKCEEIFGLMGIINPKTETTFKLDKKDGWTVEDLKVSFEMEKVEKEDK